VTDRLNKFRRYLDGPVEAHVVLGLEKFRHLADVTIDSNGHIIKGREENTDMYAAIDLVMDKIDIQLKKFRDKLRGAKGDRSRSAAPAPAEAGEARALPAIRRKRVEVPALQMADAVELMQSGNDTLLVFTDVANGNLNILYRRPDGNFILVEPDLG
jgi:putative sigma-54 modulation protein